MRSKLSKDAIKKTLDRYNFFDSNWNKSGNFKNDFVDNNDGTVADRRTGLVWQKYGSYNCMKYDETSTYLDKLNREKFAGHDDWRLPTIGELASLLQNKQKADILILCSVKRRRDVGARTIVFPIRHGASVSHPVMCIGSIYTTHVMCVAASLTKIQFTEERVIWCLDEINKKRILNTGKLPRIHG